MMKLDLQGRLEKMGQHDTHECFYGWAYPVHVPAVTLIIVTYAKSGIFFLFLESNTTRHFHWLFRGYMYGFNA